MLPSKGPRPRPSEPVIYAPDSITPVEGREVRAEDNQTGELIGFAITDASRDYLIVLMQ